MTLLEIFQESLVLAGIVQTPPATAEGQTGEYALMLRKIKQAYNGIQSSKKNWRFLWSQYQFDTISGTADYDLSGQLFNNIIEESSTIYQTVTTDKTILDDVSYVDWVRRYRADSIDNDRPLEITVLPNNQVRVTPTPDGIYSVQGDFFRTNDVMLLNTDVPIFPAKFHDLIVYVAVKKNGKFIGDEFKYQTNDRDYVELYQRMLWEELLEDDVPMVVTA